MRKFIFFFSIIFVATSSCFFWWRKANNEESSIGLVSIHAGSNQSKNTSGKPSTLSSFLSGVYPEHKISVVKSDLEIITKKVIPEYSGRNPGRGDIELCDRNNRPLKDFPHPPTCHDILESLRWCMSYYHVPNVCVEDENCFYAWYAGETFQGNIIDKKHFRRHGWEMSSEKIEFIGD
ncbi:MAG: hypothetical protein IKW49_02280 [Opitutales bacterium]|nr:hypothetical protein [Opitutales bacterium]